MKITARDKKVNNFCGAEGTVITERRIKHFTAKCRSWECEDCREELFGDWTGKIEKVWQQDRLYAGFAQRNRAALNKWIAKMGIKEAVKIMAGEDRFLLISNRSFPGSKRTRKKKVFKMMEEVLFRNDQGQNRKITTTRGFRRKLGGGVKHYNQNNNLLLMTNGYPQEDTKSPSGAEKPKLGLVKNEKLLARSFKKDHRWWFDLEWNWPHLKKPSKAEILEALEEKRIISLLPTGEVFVENHSLDIADIIIDDKDLILQLQGGDRIKIGELNDDYLHLTDTKGL